MPRPGIELSEKLIPNPKWPNVRASELAYPRGGVITATARTLNPPKSLEVLCKTGGSEVGQKSALILGRNTTYIRGSG